MSEPISPILMSFLDEMPDGVLIVDCIGVVLTVNKWFLEFTGRHREQVIGHPIESLVAEQDVTAIIGFRAAFDAEQTRDTNLVFTTIDGKFRTLCVNSARLGSSSHTVLTARSIGRVQEELAKTTRWAASEQTRADEIARMHEGLISSNTSLRRAQEELKAAFSELEAETAARLKLEGELRLSQRLESVGRLAAGIAHEINTPTQFVSDSIHFIHEGFGDLRRLYQLYHNSTTYLAAADSKTATRIDELEREIDVDFLLEQIPKSFQRCFDGIERIASIVQSVKDFAYPDTREKTCGDINRAVLSTLTICRNEYKYVADVETELGDIPPVICHLGDMNQVFLNLTVNAAHAIASVVGDTGGRGRLIVRTAVEGDTVRIEFEDTGCGIPESIQDRVFEPFFTTKDVGKGSGQGLAIARNIVVEKHGGTLTFESTPGVGTKFIITLPLTPTANRPGSMQ